MIDTALAAVLALDLLLAPLVFVSAQLRFFVCPDATRRRPLPGPRQEGLVGGSAHRWRRRSWQRLGHNS